MNDPYAQYRKELLRWLNELEKLKKQSDIVARAAAAIGGSIHTETASVVKQYHQLMEHVLLLEQEAREL